MQPAAPDATAPTMLYRDAAIETTPTTPESREVAIAFSSEKPVERYDWCEDKSYQEILDHTAENADFSLLNNGGAFLVDHDCDDQAGAVKRGSAVVGPDRVGRAIIRLSRSELGTEILQDMQDGIRSLISFGYQTTRLISSEVNAAGVETRRFAFKAYEISTVPIPADETVGVGRARSQAKPTSPNNSPQTKNMSLPIIEPTPTPSPATAPTPTPKIITLAEMQAEERKRMGEILATGKRFKQEAAAEKAISDGTELDAFRKFVMDAMKAAPDDTQTEPVMISRTVGDHVVNSDGYKKFIKQSGQRSISLDIPSGFTRATVTSVGLTSIEKQTGIIIANKMPPRVADLIPSTVTASTTIRYIQETSFTNAAAFVAEGASKPEATFALAEVDATVKKIAVIARVTDEFFADFEATRAYINLRLAYMVAMKEDDALLNADGTANQIRGLLQTVGIQTQAKATDTAPDAIMKAITKIRTIGFFEADGVILNPIDLQNLRLLKDTAGQYFFNGPFGGSYGTPELPLTPMVWGLPVIWSTSIAQGTALVGAFQLGAHIFRRMGLTVESTNSDASDFQFNRIAIRAEERLTLAVYRPLAFCTVTGLLP